MAIKRTVLACLALAAANYSKGNHERAAAFLQRASANPDDLREVASAARSATPVRASTRLTAAAAWPFQTSVSASTRRVRADKTDNPDLVDDNVGDEHREEPTFLNTMREVQEASLDDELDDMGLLEAEAEDDDMVDVDAGADEDEDEDKEEATVKARAAQRFARAATNLKAAARRR